MRTRRSSPSASALPSTAVDGSHLAAALKAPRVACTAAPAVAAARDRPIPRASPDLWRALESGRHLSYFARSWRIQSQRRPRRAPQYCHHCLRPDCPVLAFVFVDGLGPSRVLDCPRHRLWRGRGRFPARTDVPRGEALSGTRATASAEHGGAVDGMAFRPEAASVRRDMLGRSGRVGQPWPASHDSVRAAPRA